MTHSRRLKICPQCGDVGPYDTVLSSCQLCGWTPNDLFEDDAESVDRETAIELGFDVDVDGERE